MVRRYSVHIARSRLGWWRSRSVLQSRSSDRSASPGFVCGGGGGLFAMRTLL
uniref:Uncharacterized protein n=1 Tax=Arundo donax TaxID=35708 RepID=A0A0A8YBT4_ARUDO